MTSNFVPTGINCTIFDYSCEEYDKFVKVLKNPGLRRLDISLLVGVEFDSHPDECWQSLYSGHLRSALSGATEMEDFRLHITYDQDILVAAEFFPPDSLDDIVPVEKWLNLR
ncbi:unnamed protein product [Penicillium salamii]|nr:unnamed protein product [Penicillium salamii]CAG8306276.1 unnamed protein product [Penicillium salamii]